MKEKTKKKIREAYIDLCLENHFHNVRIKDVYQKSGIGKTTFYKYYKNIGEVEKDIEKCYIDDLNEIIRKNNYNNILNDEDTLPANFLDLFHYIDENQNLFQYLFVYQHNLTLLTKGKKIVYEKFQAIYSENIEGDDRMKCLANLIFDLLISCSEMMISYRNIISAESMTLLVRDAVYNLLANEQVYFSGSGLGN